MAVVKSSLWASTCKHRLESLLAVLGGSGQGRGCLLLRESRVLRNASVLLTLTRGLSVSVLDAHQLFAHPADLVPPATSQGLKNRGALIHVTSSPLVNIRVCFLIKPTGAVVCWRLVQSILHPWAYDFSVEIPEGGIQGWGEWGAKAAGLPDCSHFQGSKALTEELVQPLSALCHPPKTKLPPRNREFLTGK